MQCFTFSSARHGLARLEGGSGLKVLSRSPPVAGKTAMTRLCAPKDAGEWEKRQRLDQPYLQVDRAAFKAALQRRIGDAPAGL